MTDGIKAALALLCIGAAVALFGVASEVDVVRGIGVLLLLVGLGVTAIELLRPTKSGGD